MLWGARTRMIGSGAESRFRGMSWPNTCQHANTCQHTAAVGDCPWGVAAACQRRWERISAFLPIFCNCHNFCSRTVMQ